MNEQIQKAFDAKFEEVGEDVWHDIGNDKIFEFGWQAATSECVKLLDEQDKAYNQQTNALIKRHAEQLEEAKNRMNDMLLSDDGQAHKEARKFIERIEVAQPTQESSESEKTWSYAVATIIGVYLNESIDSEKCKAIGAIIERRLWSLPHTRKESVDAELEAKREHSRATGNAFIHMPSSDDCRSELVVAIHSLASNFENCLGSFKNDLEAFTKAKGDIAHAMNIANKWNKTDCSLEGNSTDDESKDDASPT